MNPASGMEIGAWIASSVVILCIFFWLKLDSEAFLRKSVKRTPTDSPPSPPAEGEWQQLIDRAGAVVQAAIAELPDDVRAEAESVPVLFEERAANEKPGTTTLGIYQGFVPNHISPRKGPIVLYLRSIEDYAGRFGGAFEDQVRRTFLHELGHHLGWGEVDVRARGL